jgi:cell division protease FtsH
MGLSMLAGLVLALTLYALRPGQKAPEVPFSDFQQEVALGKVSAVTLSEREIEYQGERAQGRRRTTPPPGYVAQSPDLLPALARQKARVEVRLSSGPEAPGTLGLVLSGALVLLIGYLLYRRLPGRVPAGESGSYISAPSPVTFADVAGVDEAKEEVGELVEFLRDPERFTRLGGRIPRGVLLCGPPGTGKTLLARSIAGEAGVPFLLCSGSEFVEMYAGVGAARVRRLFREARRFPACIVFIDELDSVGRRRGGHSLGNEEREQTLNQLLVELDGFTARDGVVVIAATNRADILDPALLRPGRFDRQVTVDCPDLAGREAILRLHARRLSLSEDADLRAVARGTPGFSGADLANVMNEAALLSARAGRKQVSSSDLQAARDKVLMGAERRSLLLSEEERRTCAYHEAGHALLAVLLPHADPLHKVSIIPRGKALGVTMQLPEADRRTYKRTYLDARLCILMGGRVAEEHFLGEVTSGAADDIERATELARRMVCDLGMSPLGPLSFARREGEPQGGAPLSEHTARQVDEQVRHLVLEAERRARDLLVAHQQGVRAVADALLAEETLAAEQVKALLSQAA